MGNAPSVPAPAQLPQIKSIDQSFKDFVSDINKETNKLPELLKNEIGNPILSSVNVLRDETNAIAFNLDKFSTSLLKETKSNTDALKNLPDVLKSSVVGLEKKITDPLTILINDAKKQTESQINSISNNVLSLEKKIVDPVKQLIEDSRAKTLDSISIATKKIDDTTAQLKGLDKKIIDPLTSILDQIKTQSQNEFNSVSNSVLNLEKKLGDPILKAVQESKSTTLELSSQIKSLDQKIIDPLSALLNQIKTQSDKEFNSISSTVSKNTGNLLNEIRQLDNLIVDPLTDLINQATKQTEKQFNAVTENATMVIREIKGLDKRISEPIVDAVAIVKNKIDFATSKIDLLPDILKQQSDMLQNQINNLPNLLKDQFLIFQEILKKQYDMIEGQVTKGIEQQVLPKLKLIGDELGKVVLKGFDFLAMPQQLLQSILDLLLDPTMSILILGSVGVVLLQNS